MDEETRQLLVQYRSAVKQLNKQTRYVNQLGAQLEERFADIPDVTALGGTDNGPEDTHL